MASPSLTLPAPSWGGSLKARQVWAMLANGRAASRRERCQIAALSRVELSLTGGALSSVQAGFLLGVAGMPPLPPRRLASLLAVHSPMRRGLRAPPAGLASRAASPELGMRAGTQTRRIRHQPPAHVSAGEESAREPTSLPHFLGTHGVSLWECGDAKPSQGPWNLVLSVRSFVWAAKQPLKEPCCCPSLQSSHC